MIAAFRRRALRNVKRNAAKIFISTSCLMTAQALDLTTTFAPEDFVYRSLRLVSANEAHSGFLQVYKGV